MTCRRSRPEIAPSLQPTSWCVPGRLYKYDEMAAPEEGECGGGGGACGEGEGPRDPRGHPGRCAHRPLSSCLWARAAGQGDSWASVPRAGLGPRRARPVRPAGGHRSAPCPAGIGVPAVGSRFPWAPLGGGQPRSERRAAPGDCRAWGAWVVAGRLPDLAAAWASAGEPAIVHRVCASIVGKGEGVLCFLQDYFLIWLLCWELEKKIQWFYQNKLLLVPEITFLNVGRVPSLGHWGRKTAFFKFLAAVCLARVPLYKLAWLPLLG